MFGTKKCPKCGENVKSKFDFCPSCSFRLKQSSDEDWGMLGKNDAVENQPDFFGNSLFGGMGGTMLGKMLNNAMKMLENEMQKETKTLQNAEHFQKSNFELYINGKRVNPENIKVTKMPIKNQAPQKQIQQKQFKIQNTISEEKLKKMSKLPREEPKTKIKRFSDRLIYELEVPGVKSIKDIIFMKLEESLEIKAIADKKVYIKIIPINMPLINSYLSKDKLILELETEE